MDEELLDFVNALEEVKEPVETIDEKEEVKEDDIWTDINAALDNWTKRVVDAEVQQSKSKQYQHIVEEALRRQQWDGLLTHHDYTELKQIANLWGNLLNATSCYTLGCLGVKREIIAILLDLYTLKQLSKYTFVEACLKL